MLGLNRTNGSIPPPSMSRSHQTSGNAAPHANREFHPHLQGLLRGTICFTNRYRSQRAASKRLQGKSTSMPTLPKKLKHDAIIEAVLEIRFDPGNVQPEFMTGRLIDPEKWPGFTISRLATADLPIPLMRLAIPNMIYQPLFDLQKDENGGSIKIGSQSIICAMQRPYQGWDRFHELHRLAVQNLFDIKSMRIVRIGLRYINGLNTELHHIGAMSELSLSVAVGDRRLTENYAVNFKYSFNTETDCLVRVATKSFTNPPYTGPEHTIIDTDTFTPDGFQTASKDHVLAWLASARNVKNGAFFQLFTEEQIEKLREE